jgi:predicted nucleic-acid-binding Zn-ribbon protein
MNLFSRPLTASARSSGEGRFTAGGMPLACPHCGGDRFESRPVQLNTRVLTFLKLDWMNRTATALACQRCGMIQWFAREPLRVPE